MRQLMTMVLALVLVGPASAHFVWLAPDGSGAKIVFNEGPKPDISVPISKVAQTKFLARDAKTGEVAKVTRKDAPEGKNFFEVEIAGKGPHQLAATCVYGVLAKGKEPFLLMYYARTAVGVDAKDDTYANAWQPWQGQPLDIVLVKGDPRSAEVLWKGQPVPGCEVVVVQGGDEETQLKANDKGQIALPALKAAGLLGIRAKYIEPGAGELDGKKYAEKRHYATLTLVMQPPAVKQGALAPKTYFTSQESKVEAKADPAATKLLTDARRTRAAWDNFPGFTADVEVNHNGKISKGTLDVAKEGKATLNLPDLDKDATSWFRREIASLVSHRMPSESTAETPCRFADEVTHHPQGRAIQLVNDEYHSNYRIGNNQVLEVNRMMGGNVRFTISVLENHWTPEKKVLPLSYVVNTWDAKDNSLKRSMSFHHTWKRQGTFDLPETVTVVEASGGALDVRKVTFSNVKVK